MKVLSFVRNIVGSIILIIGSFIFQIGFTILTEELKDKFAQKVVEKFTNDL